MTTSSVAEASVAEQLQAEIEHIPAEHLANVLQIVRAFRASVVLPSAVASFRQRWQEAMTGNTQPVATLWDEIDAE
jgi:hypothetical protein